MDRQTLTRWTHHFEQTFSRFKSLSVCAFTTTDSVLWKMGLCVLSGTYHATYQVQERRSTGIEEEN